MAWANPGRWTVFDSRWIRHGLRRSVLFVAQRHGKQLSALRSTESHWSRGAHGHLPGAASESNVADPDREHGVCECFSRSGKPHVALLEPLGAAAVDAELQTGTG